MIIAVCSVMLLEPAAHALSIAVSALTGEANGGISLAPPTQLLLTLLAVSVGATLARAWAAPRRQWARRRRLTRSLGDGMSETSCWAERQATPPPSPPRTDPTERSAAVSGVLEELLAEAPPAVASKPPPLPSDCSLSPL